MYTKDQLYELEQVPKLKDISLKVIQEFYNEYLTNRTYTYRLRGNRSKLEFDIDIRFFNDSLPHLLAIQKVVPRPNQYLYRGQRGYDGIVNKSITIKKLQDIDSQKNKSDRIFPKIESRLTHFYLIPKLMNECKMVKFDSAKVTGNCNMRSDFMLYHQELGVKLHLGVIKEQNDTELYVPETFIVKPLRSRDLDRLTQGQYYMNIIDRSVTENKVSKEGNA